jgi:hypothetical protein
LLGWGVEDANVRACGRVGWGVAAHQAGSESPKDALGGGFWLLWIEVVAQSVRISVAMSSRAVLQCYG